MNINFSVKNASHPRQVRIQSVLTGLVSDIAVRSCYAQLDQTLVVIMRIASKISSPFQCKGHIVRLQALVGIALYGVDGQAAKPLMDGRRVQAPEVIWRMPVHPLRSHLPTVAKQFFKMFTLRAD